MKIELLRDLTRPELLQKHHDLVEELFNLRLRKRVSEINNPLQLRTLRRELARIETVLREDDLGLRKVASLKERS
jgi:large subunit ribosomal protein L29